MSPFARRSYLTALLTQSDRRKAYLTANLAGAELAHDRRAAQDRLERELGYRQDVLTERASIPD